MAQLSDLIVQYRRRIEQVQEVSAVKMSATVLRATPVDTGALRDAWAPAINGRQFANTATAAAAMQIGDDYTLTNDLPYARVIEYNGHSPQAPQGMLRSSVRQWRAIVRRAANEANR